MSSSLLKDILNDMRVELSDEFDRNFSSGGFFGQTWTRRRDGSPSHLQVSGKLRRSLRGRVRGSSVVFTSSEPYASIHNQGGELTVTAKMRRFFWAKYYRAGKKGKEADFYKAMALKKIGDKIKIPKRQFIGDDPKVRKAIEEVVKDNIERYTSEIADKFKQK